MPLAILSSSPLRRAAISPSRALPFTAARSTVTPDAPTVTADSSMPNSPAIFSNSPVRKPARRFARALALMSPRRLSTPKSSARGSGKTTFSAPCSSWSASSFNWPVRSPSSSPRLARVLTSPISRVTVVCPWSIPSAICFKWPVRRPSNNPLRAFAFIAHRVGHPSGWNSQVSTSGPMENVASCTLAETKSMATFPQLVSSDTSDGQKKLLAELKRDETGLDRPAEVAFCSGGGLGGGTGTKEGVGRLCSSSKASSCHCRPTRGFSCLTCRRLGNPRLTCR
mmetsp:Transcript_30755/g.65282  ORF Transcript_30755/g.65282 Transcript_30755/m.65282 type:complete len:282 (-) Transcript_30755:129-974(-)